MRGPLEGVVRSPEAGGAQLAEKAKHSAQAVHEMSAAEHTARRHAARERAIVVAGDLVARLRVRTPRAVAHRDPAGGPTTSAEPLRSEDHHWGRTRSCFSPPVGRSPPRPWCGLRARASKGKEDH